MSRLCTFCNFVECLFSNQYECFNQWIPPTPFPVSLVFQQNFSGEKCVQKPKHQGPEEEPNKTFLCQLVNVFSFNFLPFFFLV